MKMDFQSWWDSLQGSGLARSGAWEESIKAVSSGGGAKAVLERPVLVLQCARLSPVFQLPAWQPGPCSKALWLVALVSPTMFP